MAVRGDSMPDPFEEYKEKRLEIILLEIERLGDIGRRYAEEACRSGSYVPDDADPSGYQGADPEKVAELCEKHDLALRIYHAERIEDLHLDLDRDYDSVRYILSRASFGTEEGHLGLHRIYAELGVGEALFNAGVLTFAGYGCEPDPEEALRYILDSDPDPGDGRLRASWLTFFTSEPWILSSEAVPFRDYLRFGRVVTQDYDCPVSFFLPEWLVLRTLCADTPRDLEYCDPFEAETANELFEMHEYLYDDWGGNPGSELPNFAFKPLGLMITWYKDQKAMSMNLPLTLDQLRHIFRLCIQYIIDNKTWRRGGWHPEEQ